MGGFETEGLLFDIDEVVVASTPLQVQAEQETAREMAQLYKPAAGYSVLRNGSEAEATANWERFKGMARVSIAAEIWDIDSGSDLADEYRLSVVRKTVEIVDKENAPFIAGAEEGLRELQGWNLPMAAVTSSNRDIYDAYDRLLNLRRFFDESVAHGEAEHNKPEPHPYLLAAKRLGIPVKNSLVVEDSGSGIKSGRTAGAVVIGIATTMSIDGLRAKGVNFAVNDWPALVRQIDDLLS